MILTTLPIFLGVAVSVWLSLGYGQELNVEEMKIVKGDNETEDIESWHIEGTRFVHLRKYRGKLLIDFREFYPRNGFLYPGKRGIAFSYDQWTKIYDLMPKINRRLDSVLR